ncbi:MAG TPA: PH domain-containing protein [Planctomycetota bacterium]|jgi:hypothetical protein|nr:PH domain-containing protein [Planctomycetota bacterium]
MEGRQTFRYPLGERVTPVLLALGCALLLGLSVTHPSRRTPRLLRDLLTHTVAALGILGFGYAAWWKGRARVALDERGVEWRTGASRQELPWDRIEGVLLRPRAKSVQWALVEKGTGTPFPLPFMPRALFLALKERSRVLPAGAEEEWFR